MKYDHAPIIPTTLRGSLANYSEEMAPSPSLSQHFYALELIL